MAPTSGRGVGLSYENEDVGSIASFKKRGYRTIPVLYVNGSRVSEADASSRARPNQTLLSYLRNVTTGFPTMEAMWSRWRCCNRSDGKNRSRISCSRYSFLRLIVLLASAALADGKFIGNTNIHSLRRYCRCVINDTLKQSPRHSMRSLLQSAAIRSVPKRCCAIALCATLSSANNALAATNISPTKSPRTSPLEPAIRAIKFWRRVGPVVVHYKFTQAWFRLKHTDPAIRSETWEKLHEMHAPGSLDVILELRGLFVKIGQVMSSRADFVPRAYVDKFHTLQDAVPPWELKRVEGIARESLRTTQGLDFEDVFESFGEVLGSASIGQVHKATLTSKYASIGGYTGGKTVAVKVMHEDAEFRFRNDFKIFRALCKVALPGWDPILRELEQQMMTEFDYKNEAHNLEVIRNNMSKSPYANKVRIPEPVKELCSENLLVMEYLEGKKLAVAIEERLASILGGDVALARRVLKAKQQALFEAKGVGDKDKKGLFTELSNMVGEGNNVSLLQKGTKALRVMSMTKDARNKLSLLLDATGHQIFQDGVYNGDPHPGNILELDCGRLGLIDYGQTRRLSRDDRLALSGVVAALGKSGSSQSQSEIADAMRKFGFRSRDDNDDIIAKNAALYFDSDAAGKAMGCATPQTYLQHLNSIDPMIEVPDAAVFVARTSFLFRGLGALLQQQLHTSKRWKKHAKIALKTDGQNVSPYRLGLSAVK